MHRCLQLASYGKGFVAPNPMVGAVIVHQNKIIGEGYHRRYGEAHAEVNAIASVKDPALLKDATLYVNLEPCSHYGKTPPCAELILSNRIPRVVIGMEDPFPAVAGRGIRMLQEGGVEVTCNVLESECRILNRRFLTTVLHNRPYIILKWAQSSDGFMDIHRTPGDNQLPVQFSTSFTRQLVHKLRAEEAGISVGKNTALLDKPSLNVRYWDGKDPQRVTFNRTQPLSEQLQQVKENGIQSLVIEGGAQLLASFLKDGLWDEARIETAPVILHEGVKSPAIEGVPEAKITDKKNIILFYRNYPRE